MSWLTNRTETSRCCSCRSFAMQRCDRVVSGGFVVDDYGAIPQCARVVNDFRKEHRVEEPINHRSRLDGRVLAEVVKPPFGVA